MTRRAPALLDVTEGPLLDSARRLAELHGWLHYHAPACEHARQAEPGFPDLVLVRAPVLLALELKRPRPDQPTAAQLRWLEAIDGVRYAEAHVVRPGPTLDELEGLLR
jgi:hypothetical protein